MRKPPKDRVSSYEYRASSHEAALRPGFDRAAFNRLADELEDTAVLVRLSRPSFTG